MRCLTYILGHNDLLNSNSTLVDQGFLYNFSHLTCTTVLWDVQHYLCFVCEGTANRHVKWVSRASACVRLGSWEAELEAEILVQGLIEQVPLGEGTEEPSTRMWSRLVADFSLIPGKPWGTNSTAESVPPWDDCFFLYPYLSNDCPWEGRGS